MKPHYSIILLSLAIVFIACETPEYRTTNQQRSFCYWDRGYTLDSELWKQTDANHLYIRYFDVDWDDVSGQALPIASAYCQGSNPNDTLPLNFTPSIFLANRVFEKSSKKAIDELSKQICKRIDQISHNFARNAYHSYDYKKYDDSQFSNYEEYKQYRDSTIDVVASQLRERYTEVLIDCDWTTGTKDNFFYFVKQIQKSFKGKNISVTLRLWQYKNTEQAGIPPVKRCLLMCYNMQTANEYKVENSIASVAELKKYVSGKRYPLTLDIALPIFNWGVLFRNEKFVGLIGNVDIEHYNNNLLEYKNIGDNRYMLLEDKVIGNFLARKGDIIRVETVSKEILNEMASYLASEVPMDNKSRVTLFSWNNTYINNLGTDEIKNIYTTFSK